jgi:two-component system sensor histidine kinase KdpD
MHWSIRELRKNRSIGVYLGSFACVVAAAAVCLSASAYLGYRSVALILLMVVSLIALVLDIGPVLLAATSSALIWNYFFIPPLFTFHIGSAEDGLMFLLYFVVVLVHGVLSYRIRRAEQQAKAKEDQQKSIALYNTLLHSLSHELRTPIAAILASVDTLKNRQIRLTERQQTEILQEMDSASTRLNRQVENLLNMSRLESGMLKPVTDWCDPTELIYQLLEKLPDHRQRIDVSIQESMPLFKIDRGLLEEVLFNLLHNAIAYTPTDSCVTVSAKATNDQLAITVQDQGSGIPVADEQWLFRKFYRAAGTPAGGLGLGLSIVKGFVDAMGGTIHYQRAMPKGAQFELRIPGEISYIGALKNE